jgi:hypothetical protein
MSSGSAIGLNSMTTSSGSESGSNFGSKRTLTPQTAVNLESRFTRI